MADKKAENNENRYEWLKLNTIAAVIPANTATPSMLISIILI